jgi:hypothetical protein
MSAHYNVHQVRRRGDFSLACTFGVEVKKAQLLFPHG